MDERLRFIARLLVLGGVRPEAFEWASNVGL